MLAVGIATDTAEPLRADRARLLAGNRQQRRGLLRVTLSQLVAPEPSAGDDLSGLAAAATVELRDQAAQRLRSIARE